MQFWPSLRGTTTALKADIDPNKFDKARYGDLAKWDKNSDGKLDRAEFNSRLYAYYDTDADPAMSDSAVS